MKKICIIGAGISGLYLAYLLKKQGYYDIYVFEKEKEIGGRIKVINFEGVDVVAGAGIGRCKDKLLLNLCKELKVPIQHFQSHWDHTFDPENILEIVEQLKHHTHKFDRSKITFKEFGKAILGNKRYNNFVKSVGFSDFEDADIIDTLYDYGFEDVTTGQNMFSIQWKILLKNLQNVLKDEIFTNIEVQNIKKTVDGKFKIKVKGLQEIVFDAVVISTNMNIIKRLTKDIFNNKILNSIQTQSFSRLYVKLNKPLSFNIKGLLKTEHPFQKIIEVDRKNALYQISYSDNKTADYWKNVKNLKKSIEKHLLEILNEDRKVKTVKHIYWKEGTHYYKPLEKKHKHRDEFIREIQNPISNLYIIGEGVTRNQGWCEGALQSVENILSL